MDTTVAIAFAVLFFLALAVLAAWAYTQGRRSAALRDRFGPEYERAVHEYGDRKVAEHKLRERQERVEGFELHALKPEEHLEFSRTWREVQARFVDDPAAAISAANALIKDVMQTRGYPMGSFDQRAEDISVHHPDVVQHYRAAREIARRSERREADTEALRQAMGHYRALFRELVDERDAGDREPRPDLRDRDMRPAQRTEHEQRRAA